MRLPSNQHQPCGDLAFFGMLAGRSLLGHPLPVALRQKFDKMGKPNIKLLV